MFDDPIVFHAGGIDWQLTKIFLVGGLLLILLGILLGLLLALHTKARVRRLSAEEASDVAFLWAIVSVFLGGMEGIALFMPWAALYTSIERTAPPPSGSVDPPPR